MATMDPNPLSPNASVTPAAGSVHREPDDAEQVYFEGSPLLRGEMGKVMLWTLVGLAILASPFVYRYYQNAWLVWWLTLALIVVGLLVLVIPVMLMKQHRYRITNYRIDYERGLLGKKIETMELWHVDDIKFEQSFMDRMMGVGTITILSDDQTTPSLDLRGLPNPRPLFDSLKQRIIAVKRSRGVIKMDSGA